MESLKTSIPGTGTSLNVYRSHRFGVW